MPTAIGFDTRARPGRQRVGRRWPLVALALSLSTAAIGAGASAADADNDLFESAAGQPVDGGTLNVQVGGEFLGFDPLKLGGIPSTTVWPAIYDTLMIREDGELRPHLAESLTPNDDLTSWTLVLRPGIQFHDGTPLDAEAVKFNIERHIDPANNSIVISLASPIDTVTVVDELTVRFDLKSPWAQFPNALVSQVGTMASPTAVRERGDEFQRNPVGTGPYLFVEWVPGSSLTVTKNSDYWSADDAGHVDEIVFKVITEPETALAALQSGQVDIMGTPIVSIIEQAETAGMNVVGTADRAITTVLNSTKPPLDDVRVRQALAYATDNEAIIAAILEGRADLARPIPEGHPFFNDELTWPQYDPDRARELLDEYGGPVSLTYGCENTPDGTKLAELIQQMWGDVGIEVSLRLDESAARINRTMVDRDFDAECWALANQPWTDPDIQAYVWFHSASPINLSPVSADSAQQIDEALNTGRSNTEESVRAEAYATYEEVLAEEMPWLWHYSPIASFVFTEQVHGVTEDNAATRDTPTVPVRDIWLE